MQMKALGAALLALTMGGAAQAEVVTFEFKAVIDFVGEFDYINGATSVDSSNLNGSLIKVGDMITGRFYYDLSTPYSYTSDGHVPIGVGTTVYAVPHVFPDDPYTIEGTSAVFDRTGYQFASDPTQAYYIPVMDNAPGSGSDAFNILGYFLAKGREITYPPQTGDINFFDSKGTALSSNALPTTLNLADWSQASYNYTWVGQDASGIWKTLSVNANLTSLAQVTSPVPEPATLGMMALGVLLVGARYRSEKFTGGKASRRS